jgi:hypothetical protein
VTLWDRSGLSENHQGGKTGGVTVRMKFWFYVLISGAEKSYGGIAQLVERLVRNEKARGSNPLTSSPESFLGCSEGGALLTFLCRCCELRLGKLSHSSSCPSKTAVATSFISDRLSQ